jgi:protein SCO1/2
MPADARTFALFCLILPGCAKHYRVEGLVLQTDAAQRTMLVSHRPIQGYMPAMTMPFHLDKQEDISKLAPGARVAFELRVGKTESVARHVKVREARLEVAVETPKNKLAIGARVPDFSLTDQAGRVVRLGDFAGRVVAVDFIYTRCPLPDVCPRLSANFAYVAKRVPDATLLSITIDPQYDTPAVLSEYGRRYGSDGERWRFLTGTMDQVREVAGLFGLIYWPEDGSITHTVATGVIGRDGRLAAMVEGATFRPEQLRDLVQHELDRR